MNIRDIPQSMLDLITFRIDGDQPWGDPEEIKYDLESVSSLDPELLPDVLRTFVMDAAHRMQCAPDFVAVACIVTLGSIIGAGCGVRPKQKDDWTEYPNLWGGVVGRPGALKTPALSAGMAALAYLEDQALQEHAAAMSGYMMRKLDREVELKTLKSDKGASKLGLTTEEANRRIVTLTMADEAEPKLRRYRTNDATVEVIGELARHSDRGLLVFRDELMGLLANCEKQGHEGDRAFYLESWNGRNRFMVDRIGRGNIFISRLCLSLFGGIQPSKLQDFVFGAVSGFENDGLLQRFQLLVYPDDVVDWQYIDQTPDAAAIDQVVAISKCLADTDFVSLGAIRDDETAVPYFRFNTKAQKIFIKWLINHERVVRLVESPVMAEHLGKYRKLVPALALIFHLVDVASGKASKAKGISPEALKLAIAWDDFLQAHAYRIYSMALDPVRAGVTTLAAKLQTGKLVDGFSERDIYKSDWANLKDVEIVQASCAELEMCGWIRRIPVERGVGRPQSPSYNINPALKAK